jgi:uncharacterized protein YggU (UPF0235/DUF167 family)
VDGKANTAVLETVAAAFGLPRTAVELVSGQRGRDKVLELDGHAADLGARLAELLDE